MQVHPSQISPGEPFDVFYFIRNHTDATTYYVKAVVYDVQTGEVLDTQTLSQSATNSRLFIKRFQAPPDPSGYGRNIVAVATVYTDSGYTAKSENYEEQEAYYLIKSIPLFGGGGGGIDYRVVEDIVAEQLKKALGSIKTPDAPDMPFDSIFGALGAITREIGRIPKEAADHSELSQKLSEIQSALAARPQFEKTDLSGIEDALFQLATGLDTMARGLDALPETLTSAQKEEARTTLNTMLEAFMGEIRAQLDELFKIKQQKQHMQQVGDDMQKYFKQGMSALSPDEGAIPGILQGDQLPDISHLMNR